MAIIASARKPRKAAAFSAEFVSVVVRINDHKYSVDLLPDSSDRVRGCRLTKHAGRDNGSYDVCATGDGLVTCSCPSYASTHAGTSSLCKHGRALVTLGLLPAPAPVAPQVDHTGINPAPEPCCSPAESRPCVGCMEIISTPGAASPPAERPLAFEPDPEPSTPAFAEIPGDEPDANDNHVSSAPNEWPDEVDAFVWSITDPVAEPTDADLADMAEVRGEMAAAAHLDQSDRMGLDDLVIKQCEFYRSWGNDAGEMIARALDELALKVRLVDAATHEARIETRLCQDKRVDAQGIIVQVEDDGTAVLKGLVPDAAHKEKAVALTRDTRAVERIVDELAVSPPPRVIDTPLADPVPTDLANQHRTVR